MWQLVAVEYFSIGFDVASMLHPRPIPVDKAHKETPFIEERLSPIRSICEKAKSVNPSSQAVVALRSRCSQGYSEKPVINTPLAEDADVLVIKLRKVLFTYRYCICQPMVCGVLSLRLLVQKVTIYLALSNYRLHSSTCSIHSRHRLGLDLWLQP
jgi:hypothetical protein